MMNVFGSIVLLVAVARASATFAGPPGSTAITCDTDWSAFRAAAKTANQVAFRLWDAPSGGTQCGQDHVVPMTKLVVDKRKRDAIGGVAAKSFARIDTVIGNDANPVALCTGPESWLDVTVATQTLACDFASPSGGARRRLESVAFARESDLGPIHIAGDKVGVGASSPQAPLHVVGDVDGQGILLDGAGITFSPPGDPTGGLALYRGGTGFGVLRRYAADYTIFQVWAPPAALGSNEATLALVRGDEPDQEYVDIYNNGYASETQFGFRMQKRGSGQFSRPGLRLLRRRDQIRGDAHQALR